MDEIVRNAIKQGDRAASDCDEWFERRRAKSQQENKPAQQTDADIQAQWDAWFDAKFEQLFMGEYKETLAYFVSEYVHQKLGELRAEFRAEIRKIPHGRDGRSIIGPQGPPGKDGVMIYGEQQERGVVLDLPQFVKKRDLNA